MALVGKHITNLLAETNVQAIVFNIRDITERKQADETLQKSEERFRGTYGPQSGRNLTG